MAQKENGDAVVKVAARRHKLHYRGVRKMPWGKFTAEIRQPGTKKNVWLGTFGDPEKAAVAYDTAARLFYRRKAKTNFPPVIEDDIENVKYFLEKFDESSAIWSSSRAGSKRKGCLETLDFLGSWCGVHEVQPPATASAELLDLELRLAPPGRM